MKYLRRQRCRDVAGTTSPTSFLAKERSSRFFIDSITNNALFLEIATVGKEGKRRNLLCLLYKPGDDNFSIPDFKYTQFSVWLCFAITSNKAQGQSFCSTVGLDLEHKCFTHGQRNVATSKLHTHQISICLQNAMKTKAQM